METVSIPALADNVIYMVIEDGVAVVIDPGESVRVLEELATRGARLDSVLLTHWHGDHTAGASAIRKATECMVVGPVECRGVGLDREVSDGDLIHAGRMTFGVLATPGHTVGHVCYHLAAGNAIWTGDTLFVGGCGRILEGNAATMWRSLCKLRELPPETVVHSGHDYTLDNLEFAAEILSGDRAITRRRNKMLEVVESGRPAASSTIADERDTNIFLRSDTDTVRSALGMSAATPVEVFAELRRRKDGW
jgi:hydroxyacylglutathione hydrolase